MEKNKNKKKLILIVAALIFMFSIGIVKKILGSQELNILFYGFEQSVAYKIQNILQEANIPYKITINIEDEYCLIVDDKYTVDALIVLWEHYIYDRKFKFNFDLFEKLALDYYDKLEKYFELQELNGTADGFPQGKRQLALCYYLSKQLMNFQGVQDAEVSMTKHKYVVAHVVLHTTQEFNDSDGQVMAQFMVDNIPGLESRSLEIYNQDFDSIFFGAKSDKIIRKIPESQ